MNEGKKDRRDPIRTVKPRNFVAKNASSTTSGAGAHKDKKKAAKQGDVKHKNQEYAESLQHMLESALRDKEDLQAKRKTLQDLSMNKDVDQKAVTQRKLDLEKEAKKKGISEGRVKELMMDLRALNDAEFQARYKMTKAEARAGLSGKNESVEEEFDSPEYNDEAGMAKGNLITLARAVKGLMDVIDDNDNLPEWCQEKIAKSEMMLVTVWDYILSQKEQGIDPQVGEAMRPGFTHHDAGEAQRRREKTLADNPRIAAEVERRRKAAEEKKKQQGESMSATPSSGAAKTDDKLRAYYAARKAEKEKQQGVAEGWRDEADDFSEWSDYVKEKLSKVAPEQRLGLAKKLSQVEVKNFGSTIQGGFNKQSGKPQAGLGLTDTVRSIMRSFGKEADDTRRAQAAIDGTDGPAGNFSMAFGSVNVAGLEDAPPEVLRVMKKAVMLGADVAAAARNFYKKHGTLTDQDLPMIQQGLASAASDEWKKQGRTAEAMRPGFTHRDAGIAQDRREKTLADNPRIAAEVERRRKAAEEKKKQQSTSEGWTHDSLASRLFETENTYEQQLAGKLARQLKNNK